MPTGKKTTKKAAPAKNTAIKIPELQLETIGIRIRGRHPGLLTKRWNMQDEEAEAAATDKGKAADKDAATGKPHGIVKAPELTPFEQAENGRYHLSVARDGCVDGVPAGAFMAAMIRAGQWTTYKMTELRGAMFVVCHTDGLVPVHSLEPVPVTHRIQINPKQSRETTRPCYESPWYATVDVEFNASVIPAADVVALLNLAGHGVGVGAFRPERSGVYGRFEVVADSVYEKGVAALRKAEVAAAG